MSCIDVCETFAKGQWLINSEKNIVSDALSAYVQCSPELAMLDIGKVVIRRDHITLGKVKILSGCASGHEPAYAGYVGKGMLTASVQGDIFSSPSTELIYRTIKQLSRRHEHGILIIIGNNESDRLNFGLAMERTTNIENVLIKMINVTDECKSLYDRRGLVGTILVQKIAGAMAEQNMFFDEIYNFCQSILPSIASVMVSFKTPETPYLKVLTSMKSLGMKEMSFGGGLHGEPGYATVPLKSTNETVSIMLDIMLDVNNSYALNLDEQQSVIVVVNNLGACTQFEEKIFLQQVISQLQARNIIIVKVYCGSFLTSLRMYGISLTIMKITDPKVVEYLEFPCSIPFWTPFTSLISSPELPLTLSSKFTKEEIKPKHERGPRLPDKFALIVRTALTFACDALISCERQLNIMDSEMGDGDTGTNLKKCAIQIFDKITNGKICFRWPFVFLKNISGIIENSIGGLLGCLYSIMFETAAQPFAQLHDTFPIDEKIWLQSFKTACQSVQRYGRVKVGDNTMYDPLIAAVETLERQLRNKVHPVSALEAAVQAAELTAKKTKAPSNIHPDPGAHAVGIWLRAVYEAVKLTWTYL